MPAALKLITDRQPDLAPTEAFVEAMSMLASGVVLVTCWVGGRPWGMTVTAFAAVSADPPTVLLSLGSGTTGAHAIATTGAFGVSILTEGQIALAHYGAEAGEAKFLEAFTGAGDPCSASPVVAGALAHLDCEVADGIQVADHTVFFGRVRATRPSRGGRPLLYHRRDYRTLADDTPAHASTGRSLECLSS
jgi:flavin reductase (DIM6/NTAB) family NADH-FMN oxidoreductase RutF